MRLHELDLNFLKKKEEKIQTLKNATKSPGVILFLKKKKSSVKGIKEINIQLRSQTRRLGKNYEDNWLKLSLQHRAKT